MALVITTPRLTLHPLDAAALEAFVAGDTDRLEALTGATFSRPLAAPPLMADALPFMRDRLRAQPDELGLWAWLMVDEERRAVGSAGFGGAPDEAGWLVLGYAVYPQFEGRGYAAEAAGALVAWALGRPGVAGVRATIPPGHARSLRVAEKAGLAVIGRDVDPEVGEVLVLGARAGG
jgi:RimJ/RimL family protein N-acetyltransferase